jgi:transposase
LTALAFELIIGTPERFACGKQIASYVGPVPWEESSGDRRRLVHISKQGNSLLPFLLVEAEQAVYLHYVLIYGLSSGARTWRRAT